MSLATVAEPHVRVPSAALSPIELLELVHELGPDPERWLALAEHHPEERWFRRVEVTERYDLWLIGWDSYQGVDLHDHGGSNGALHVVDGELRETSTRVGGGVHLVERQLPEGTARAFGPGHVHRVVNPSVRVATSLHAYSPPLSSMDFYAAVGGALDRTHSEPALGSRNGAGELR